MKLKLFFRNHNYEWVDSTISKEFKTLEEGYNFFRNFNKIYALPENEKNIILKNTFQLFKLEEETCQNL